MEKEKLCVSSRQEVGSYIHGITVWHREGQAFHSFVSQSFKNSEDLRRMTLFWNTWNPLIYAIAGPPRHDGWVSTENDKLALKYTSSPSLCILLSPETWLTFLFLSWLGSSGASSPMSRGLRYSRTMSGSTCMALKTSCESERTIRGLKKTCLQQRYLPFLISFCTNLRNQHRLCYRAFTSNSRLTFQVHCSKLPLKFLYGSLTMVIHPLSA